MTAETLAAPRTFVLPPLLEAMRPYQWPKNVIVFAGFVFSAGHAWKLTIPARGGLALAQPGPVRAVGSVSSAVYLVNDIRDRDADRHHPRKRSRATARGALSARTAWVAAVVLFVVGILRRCWTRLAVSCWPGTRQ